MKCKYDNSIEHTEAYFKSEENHEAFHNIACPLCNYKIIDFPKDYICQNCRESLSAKIYIKDFEELSKIETL